MGFATEAGWDSSVSLDASRGVDVDMIPYPMAKALHLRPKVWDRD